MKKVILVLVAALSFHSLTASASLKEVAQQRNAAIEQVVVQINELTAELNQTQDAKARQHLRVLLNERMQLLNSLISE